MSNPTEIADVDRRLLIEAADTLCALVAQIPMNSYESPDDTLEYARALHVAISIGDRLREIGWTHE